MNTILTDDELPPLQPQHHPEPHSFAWTEQEMRAIRARDRLVEAAVLAKLAQQWPVGFIHPQEVPRLENGETVAFRKVPYIGERQIPVFLRPVPQHADRQRVPEGYVLVPAEPTCNMLAAMSGEWHPSRHGKAREQYAAMLTAAPEAPAQASAVDERAAITEEDAYEMGAKGAKPTEHERKLFEAWMRGHCWALSAHWDGRQYVSDAEQDGDVDPRAVATRRIFAAWRDRAALAQKGGK